MTDILYRWLDEELRIPVAHNVDDFLRQFGNGHLLGKILNVEGILPDKKFDQLRTNDLYEDRLYNFLVIGPYMKLLGVNLSVRQARNILSDKPGSLTYLIYQVYLALHKPREQLRLKSPKPLSDTYKERLRASARPDLRDSGLTSLALTCQCYGQDVAKTRLTEAHYVKECQQRITKEGESKKELADEINNQMIEEYMKGDSAKLWGRAFRSSVKSAPRRELERKQADAAAMRQQISNFDATADVRRGKYEDVRNAEFLQTTVSSDMIPDDLVNTEANKQFVHKLRCQLNRDTKARFDREKRRKQMYLALRDEQRRREEERREMDLVRRLLRRADCELRLAAHLTDIKRQKEVIVRNRLEKDQQLQERRQDEYERSIRQQMELVVQKRIEHQEELLKEAQLHRRLLQERRADKVERQHRLAQDVVEFCMDMAILTVDYKTKSGDKEVPQSMLNDWRQLFIRVESLCDGTDPEELSATSAFTLSQQALLQEQDLAQYMSVADEWVIQERDSGKKRSAHARDDVALQTDALIVTGFVVHRLLRMVYPPKQPINAPSRPAFTLMGVVMGKVYAGKTHCLKNIQSSHGLYHIEMHELVKRSLAVLEEATQLELEVAGSSIMETLNIADILPDLSTEKMVHEATPSAHEGEQPEPRESISSRKGSTEKTDQPSDTDPPSQAGDEAASGTGEVGEASPREYDQPQVQGRNQGSQQKVKLMSSRGKGFEIDLSPGKPSRTEESVSNDPITDGKLTAKADLGSQLPPGNTFSEGKQGKTSSNSTVAGVETPTMKAERVDESEVDGVDGDDVGAARPEENEFEEETLATSDGVVSFEFSTFAELGRDVKRALESGQRVSDETMAGLVLEAWKELPEDAGWLIEGFPNTIEQAILLEEQLVGKAYDSDEEMDEVEIEVTPLPRPEPPVCESKQKKKKGGKGNSDKKGKGNEEPPPPTEAPPPPPPEPVYTRVRPFRRSRLVPDRQRREKPRPTSGLDLVVELAVSDEVAQQRRCQLTDDIDGQPDSGNVPPGNDDHVMLAGKLFSYGELLQSLESFYRERGVFQQIDANTTPARVEEQLLEFIEAGRARKEAERLVAERQRALLYAAENEPDSEPEEEPVVESPPPEKGKRGKSSKKAMKEKASDHKLKQPPEKKGQGKGKNELESEPAPGEEPQIPDPPPMPVPGEAGYYFVDSPVPESVAKYLVLVWQQMEHSYIDNLKQWLGAVRLERAAVIQHLHAVRVSFDTFLLRPDLKQQFLDRYVSEYSQVAEDLQSDEEVKCEWYMRIKELEDTMWNITDTRRCEAEQERFNVMSSGWIEDRLALTANDWLMVMQAEVDRFQDTSQVLEDYFISMSGAQLPENDGHVHGFKQGMIEIPSREQAVRSSVSSAASDGRRSGSRSSSSSRPLRRSAAGGHQTGSAGSGTLPTIAVPQLRPRLQFVRGRNQSDEVTAAVEGVLDAACKAMLAFVHDGRERGETHMRQAIAPPDDAKPGKGGKKAAAAAAARPAIKGRGHAATVEDDVEQAAAAARQERSERMLAEYQVAAREESARASARLALVRTRAVAQLQEARQRAVDMFQQMWAAIGDRYGREVTAAAHMADYLRSAVERQQRLDYELVLDQDRFLVRTGALTHVPCVPSSPPPPAEALLRDSFSLDQTRFFWQQLHTAAPTGTITTRAFCFILQDLVACGVGTQELPELWMSLTQAEIESLSARIADGAEVMSWRGLLYDILEPWSRPDQYDIEEAVSIAHVFDKEGTGQVTQAQALQVVHWMKPLLDESDQSFNRAYYMKRLAVAISGAPGDDTVDYLALLLWLCRGEDVLQSFLLALSVLEGTPVFISNPEDEERYYLPSQVDLKRIQSVPNQSSTSPPPADPRPRFIRLTKSGPVSLVQPTEKDATADEVVLRITRSDVYHLQSDSQPSQRQQELTPLVDVTNLVISGVSYDHITSIVSPGSHQQQDDTSSEQEQVTLEEGSQCLVLDEMVISASADHTVDSWTELGPSCCSHPAEAPTPSSDNGARAAGLRDSGNKTTLNSVRTVLTRTMVLPAKLLSSALERLDLDLSLVYRDLYGGSCYTVVEALRRGDQLPVPILDVFHHPIMRQYLSGQCTLLSGRSWQIIKDLRSPPSPTPSPSPSATEAAASTAQSQATAARTSVPA